MGKPDILKRNGNPKISHTPSSFPVSRYASLYHWIVGGGVPVAGQGRVTLWFSITLEVFGVVEGICGGSESYM